jgi:SagB-type dehydrogenase family enzyme
MGSTSSQYHRETSYDRDKMSGGFLDWRNQPDPFKKYQGTVTLGLPGDIPLPEENLSSLLRDVPREVSSPDRRNLSQVLRMAYSLTAKTRFSGGEFSYRSVASAGALYPTEIYLAVSGVEDLPEGLYHFSVAHHALDPLRKGDPIPRVMQVTGWEGRRNPFVALFLTVIFFRSAWKYRDRAYRYHLLDTGHLVENLSLALKSVHLPYSLLYDFDDREANHLLGLDEKKEVTLAAMIVPGPYPVSPGKGMPEERTQVVFPKAEPVSAMEKEYPKIYEIHRAGEKILAKEPQGNAMVLDLGISPREWNPLPSPTDWPETVSFPEAVMSRRSKRNFVKKTLPESCFTALLDGLCSDASTLDRDVLACGFLADRVEEVSSGFYLMDMEKRTYGLVKPGFFSEGMARICLDQIWLAGAPLHLLFLVNLKRLDQTLGPRGYRYAMLDAGRLGERIYLGATAMGLGCCGIGAFYDAEASQLLSLNDSSHLLYLVAVGIVKSR